MSYSFVLVVYYQENPDLLGEIDIRVAFKWFTLKSWACASTKDDKWRWILRSILKWLNLKLMHGEFVNVKKNWHLPFDNIKFIKKNKIWIKHLRNLWIQCEKSYIL